MCAPLQGCSMQEVKVWWPAVVVCMMMRVANIAVAAPEPVREEDVTINTDNLFQIIDEQFLSLTIDPAMLLFGKEFSTGRMRILNLARGLNPAYLRLGGPDCNHYHFLRSHVNEAQHENYTITDMQWVDVNQFAQEAGLKLVVCLNILQRVNGVWDSRNSLDLIAFSDEMGYNVAWELGFELQEIRTEVSAAQYGQDVARLRNILDAFPRYQHSLILGPDITRFKNQEDIDFLKNYFNEGGSALNGITWHPKFTHQDNSIATSENVILTIDQLVHDKEVLDSVLGMAVTKKPLWIGDRQSESSHGWFLDALTWADKLGVAAQMGVQVIMRQPHLYGLFEPTPDYWVSLLHKALVGRVVLDVKRNHSNNTHIHMYCHCTNHHTAGLFGKAVNYKHGAITCFGISHLRTKVKMILKLGSAGEWNDEVHQYLLTSAGNGQKLRETLMNGQPLILGDKGTLPVLSPDIYHTGQSLAVTLPPTSIGFWVLPGVQAEACLAAPFDSTSKASNSTTYHNIRPTKSRQYHNLSHSDQEADSLIMTESREYGFNDTIRQYNVFSSKIMEDTRSETDKGDFESNNAKMMKESDVNVKSKSIRKNRDETEITAQGRYKRYTSESGKYLIPGLQPDNLQAKNGITIKNLIGRRNTGDRSQKFSRISAHDSNIHPLLHEPYHHVNSEDGNGQLPGINSDRLEVNSFKNSNIYIQQGGKSLEERNNDYDYVDRDENVYEGKNIPHQIEYFQQPTEYFEVFHKSGIGANQKFADYHGELSEAESIALMKPLNQEWKLRDDDDDDDDDDDEYYKVIQEHGLTAQENHKAKSVATRMLNTYHSETKEQDSSDEGEDFAAERRVRGKYQRDIKKEISNRLTAVKRNQEKDYPDLSSLIEKLKKEATTALAALNNKYNYNTDAPTEEVEIVSTNHRIKETATKDHKNIPRIAAENYQEGYRTRQGKENSEIINLRNDRKITRDDDHENHNKHAEQESPNNVDISSSLHSNRRVSKEGARKISHQVNHENSNENTNSDTTHKQYKQNSKTSITQKSFQRTAEDSYDDYDEIKSRDSKQSAQHNVKLKVHNQRTDRKTENSEKDKYTITDDWYAQINPTKVSEADSEGRVMITYSQKMNHHYQQNNGNSTDINKVHEKVSAVKGQNSTEGINLSHKMKQSGREISNLYRIGGAMGVTVKQKLMPTGQQSEEESDIKCKNRHSLRTEVTSYDSKEMTEIDDKQEKIMERKMNANKSRQTNQVTIRTPTSNKEAMHRVKRDVPSQLSALETAKENRHMQTETNNATAQEKETESETISDPINAELQMTSQNIKVNNQSQTAYKRVPVATNIKSNEDLQLDQTTKSSEGTNTDHSTQKYSTSNTHKESSGNEYEKYKNLTTEVSTNPQQKIGNTLMDKNHYEEYKADGTNQTHWELHSDVSVEQSQNEGNIKREIGSNLTLEPYKYIGISNSMMEQAVADATQHQHKNVLTSSSSVQEGKGQCAMDISTGETVPPVVMDRTSETEHDTTQKTMTVNNQEGTTDVDKVKNTYMNQDGALTIKMYQENTEPASGVIRLPKATETQISLQHGPGKVTTGAIHYNELISNTEKYKHKKNKIATDEETRQNGVWNMGIPVKMIEVLPVDKSSILSGKGNPSILLHKGAKISHDLPPSFRFGNSPSLFMSGNSNKKVTDARMLSKKQQKTRWNRNQSVDTLLHLSEQQHADEENLIVQGENGGQRGGWPHEKTIQINENGQHRHSKHKTSKEQVENEVVPDVAKKTSRDREPLHTLAGNTSSKNPSLNNNAKLYVANSDKIDAATTELSEFHVATDTRKIPIMNDVRTETLGNLKNIHDKVKTVEDEALKITHNIMGPKSAENSFVNGDSDKNGLVLKVNAITAELKKKNEKEQFSAEKALKSVPDFKDGKFTMLSKIKETDVNHSKLQDITTNYISDDKNVADLLVRNAKDIGHLKHITARKENSNLFGLDNTSDNIKFQLSTLPKMDKMKTHLEKTHLDILHALTAQRAKLKEDLLKIRVMAAEGKLKLPHHINRRDTNKQNELMSRSETEDSHAQISIQNEDQKDCCNKDKPSIESQDFGDIDSDSRSYTEQNNDKYYAQEIYKLLKLMFQPESMTTDVKDIQVPMFGRQHVYKTRHYSESEILPRSYVSDKEDQSLVQQPKSFISGDVPSFILHDMGPTTMYAESMSPESHTEEKEPNKENVFQIFSPNSSSNQTGIAEEESLGDGHIEIKQLSLPLLLPRPVPRNDPMMVWSKMMPTSENEIRFFLDSETNEADADDRDLTREENHISFLLPVTRSDSSHSSTNLGKTDDTSFKKSWKLHNNGNTRTLLMPVTEKNNLHRVLSQVNFLSGVAGRYKRKENGRKMDEYIHKDRKPSMKHLTSPNKTTESDKSLHSNGRDEAEPSTLRLSDTINDINKHEDICQTCDKHKISFIFQPLTQDLDNNSELTLGPDNSNSVPIRSERAISYPFYDNLLKPSRMVSNQNPRTEDIMSGKQWIKNFFKNNSTSLGKTSNTAQINNNMYHNAKMTMNNELITSDVTPDNDILIKFKFNSEDNNPANSLNITNFKLITEYQSTDSENVTDENGLGSQMLPGISGDFLSDITNAAEYGEKVNEIQDVLRETSNYVNLQTNEINKQFRNGDSFLKSENDNRTTKPENEENAVGIKSIPYKFHKHVLNSNYEPTYKKIRKYLNLYTQKPSSESSEEFPSTVTKLQNRSSPLNERSNAIKEIISITIQEFPNIKKKSKGILESKVSYDANTITDETPRTATEHNDISKVPADNIMTERNTNIFIDPNDNKQSTGSFIILQTYPKDDLNNLTASTKNVTTLEKKAQDVKIISNTEEDPKYSDIVHRNTQHEETGSGQQETDYTQREKKSTSTTGLIHTFIKNISDHIVKFFHNIPPWNYFSPQHTIRPL